MRRFSWAALLFANSFLAAADGPLSGVAKLWTVHIDEVDAANVEAFEKLVAAQSSARRSILEQRGLPVSPGYEFSTTRSTYFTLRPRASYADLDAPSKLPDDVRKLLREKVESFDDAVHAALRTHSSQIWNFDADSSYLPVRPREAGRLPAFVHLHSEWVKPGKSAEYDEVVSKFRDALSKAKSTLGLCVFSSSYGDGSARFLWSADSREEFLLGSDTGRLLAAAYGKTEADRLMRRWRECVFRADDVDGAPRPDLNAGDRAWGWLGARGLGR